MGSAHSLRKHDGEFCSEQIQRLNFIMATIKVACPKCGQKVSGDENFYGTAVECPICSASIQFPGERREVPEGDGSKSFDEDRDFDKDPIQASETQGLHWEEPPAQSLQNTEKPEQSPKESDGEWEEEDEVPSPLFGAVSIVSSVLGLVTCVGSILFAPIAIIFGHAALAKARRSPVQPAPGQTLGAIGLMIGYICLVLVILFLGIAVLFSDSIREFFQNRAT